MGFIKNLFNRSVTQSRFEMIEDKGNGFYSWNGNIYKSDIVRACIRPKVKAIGKLIPQHIRNNSQQGFSVNPEVYIRFLYEEPNPYMSGSVFREKMATQLALNNNAFALLVRDDNGYPLEIYNIPCLGVEAVYDDQGNLYLKFTNRNGKIVTYPYTDIIHLRQDINENDIFGESPREALLPLMDVVTTTDQGIVKAIKNSSVVRWLLKFMSNMRPEDIQTNTENFTKNFLSTDSVGGAAGIDNKMDAQQIEPKDYVPNASIIDRTTQRIYSFFNTNEKIVQSKYSEDEWNAYYESEIEPIALQWSAEDTRKLFNRRERGFGNQIIYAANNLQYASMATKLNLMQMVDRGALTPNEWRQVLNLPPKDGGDELIRRLDTAVVNEIEDKIYNKVLKELKGGE